jgi:hypothetical protein
MKTQQPGVNIFYNPVLRTATVEGDMGAIDSYLIFLRESFGIPTGTGMRMQAAIPTHIVQPAGGKKKRKTNTAASEAAKQRWAIKKAKELVAAFKRKKNAVETPEVLQAKTLLASVAPEKAAAATA